MRRVVPRAPGLSTSEGLGGCRAPGSACPGSRGGDALGAGHGCLAGGGAAGPGEGAAAGGEAGGVQRDDAGALGGVQALPQAHLHALLLPHVPQRLGAGGAAGEWSRSTWGC